MAKLVSKTYGQALFDLAIENNVAHEIKEEVLMLRKLIQTDTELLEFLNQPRISKEEKISLIESIFNGRISQTMLGFLVTIVTKGRYDELDQILKYYLDQMKELDGIGVVAITTAAPLNEEQMGKINDRLLELTKYKSLEINVTVDESLIGGLIIRIGDRIVDNSIKTKLYSLQKNLLRISLS